MAGRKRNRSRDGSHSHHEEDIKDIERGGLRKAKRKSRRRQEKQVVKDIYYGTRVIMDDLDPDPLYGFEDED